MNTTGTRYRTLKSIFHERGKAAAQTELQARRNGHSTYLLNDFTVGAAPPVLLGGSYRACPLRPYYGAGADYRTAEFSLTWCRDEELPI